jgi:hypothetical protein
MLQPNDYWIWPKPIDKAILCNALLGLRGEQQEFSYDDLRIGGTPMRRTAAFGALCLRHDSACGGNCWIAS